MNYEDISECGQVLADIDSSGNLLFKKMVVLYPTRDACTLNHEAMHGLKLRHTHIDGNAITSEESKYVFPHAFYYPTEATNNVMSYRDDAYITWRWQWEILKRNI